MKCLFYCFTSRNSILNQNFVRHNDCEHDIQFDLILSQASWSWRIHILAMLQARKHPTIKTLKGVNVWREKHKEDIWIILLLSSDGSILNKYKLCWETEQSGKTHPTSKSVVLSALVYWKCHSTVFTRPCISHT